MAILPERVVGPPAQGDAAALRAVRQIDMVANAMAGETHASVRILDRAGIVVGGHEDLGRSYAQLPEVRQALIGHASIVLRRRGNYAPHYPLEFLSRAANVKIHLTQPVTVDAHVIGVVLISRSPRSVFLGIGDDLGQIGLGVALIFGALLLLAGLLSRAIARPIERLSAASRSVAAGGSTVIPPTPRMAAVEIQALYHDFRRMAERIERRTRYLRDFAAAISHEFKTPIAGMRGAMEILLDHQETMSLEDRRRFLGNALGDSERLSRLTSRLLELARADMAPRHENTVAALPTVVARVADAFSGPAFTIRSGLFAGSPSVLAPADMLETVLATLLENSRQAGATRVEIAVRDGETQVVVTVDDNGPGVPPSEQARLFQPFYTTRRGQGGTGLGLSIARALMHSVSGDLWLEDTPQGARFAMSVRRFGQI